MLKDGGVGADAEGQGLDGDYGERRRLAEHAQAVADVEPKTIPP